MPKLPTTIPTPAALLCAIRDIFIFLCNWQSGREQQRKSICLQSLKVITLHVCTLSPSLLSSSTRRSLLSPHCSLDYDFLAAGLWTEHLCLRILKVFYFPKSCINGSSWRLWIAHMWPKILKWGEVKGQSVLFLFRSCHCFGVLAIQVDKEFDAISPIRQPPHTHIHTPPPPRPPSQFATVTSHPSNLKPTATLQVSS